MKKSLKFKKRFCNVGFTLVELVIVIAIVIILSVISVPIYRGYVDKSKMAEGYALLGNILSAQKAYYSEYGHFLNNDYTRAKTVYNTILGIDARGNKYFTKFRACGKFPENAIYAFEAGAIKPAELATDEYSCLYLRYNITTGASFFENNWDH